MKSRESWIAPSEYSRPYISSSFSVNVAGSTKSPRSSIRTSWPCSTSVCASTPPAAPVPTITISASSSPGAGRSSTFSVDATFGGACSRSLNGS